MTKAMIEKDMRLFLFQVLEYGLNRDIIDKRWITDLQNEGARMSFVFAKKYYSVVHEAHLRQASHCVLGIINIGLLETSGEQLEDAAYLIIKKGYTGIFRDGWTCLLNLVQYAENSQISEDKTTFELEREFAESLSAEPNREWIGHQEYLVNMVMYSGAPGKEELNDELF